MMSSRLVSIPHRYPKIKTYGYSNRGAKAVSIPHRYPKIGMWISGLPPYRIVSIPHRYPKIKRIEEYASKKDLFQFLIGILKSPSLGNHGRNAVLVSIPHRYPKILRYSRKYNYLWHLFQFLIGILKSKNPY